MPAGSPRSTGARRSRPSTWPRGRYRLHVWVDETRPRNQGASLTAWELGHHGVPHTVDRRQCRRPPDAARPGRSLIVGTDRTTARATSATRSAPISRRSRPTTTACPSTLPCPRRPSTGRSGRRPAKSRSSSGKGRGFGPDRPHGGWPHAVTVSPTAPRSPTTPST